MRIDSPTAASMSASVSMLSAHRPASANDANAAIAQTAARSPPKRQDSSVPATVVPIHVSQIRRSLNQVTRLSAKTRKPSKSVKRSPPPPSRRWSMRYVWTESNFACSPFQTRSFGHGYSLFQPR